jgi:hypothetical protein
VNVDEELLIRALVLIAEEMTQARHRNQPVRED